MALSRHQRLLTTSSIGCKADRAVIRLRSRRPGFFLAPCVGVSGARPRFRGVLRFPVAFGRTDLALEETNVARSDDPVARRIIDKSALAISEPKRIRCKEHLRYVASQPCVICGRSPSHAHHVRYAQRRGLG